LFLAKYENNLNACITIATSKTKYKKIDACNCACKVAKFVCEKNKDYYYYCKTSLKIAKLIALI